MGCSQSSSKSVQNHSTEVKKEPSAFDLVRKRDGHPTNFKIDGYEIGLRIKDNVNGVFSTYVGTGKATQNRVSIKEFHVQSKTCDSRLMKREISILHKLSSHISVPKLYELFLTDSSVYMITQYVDMFRLRNFVDLKSNKVAFTLPEVRRICKKLLNAIEYCHQNFIILRCLTPDNILVKKVSDTTNATNTVPFGETREQDTEVSKIPEYEVMLTDLSMAVVWDNSDQTSESLFAHPLFDWQMLAYCSPEIVSKLPVDPATDLWSLGVLVFLLVSGALPFVVPDMLMDRADLAEKIKNTDYSFSMSKNWEGIRMDVKGLINHLLVSNPVHRSSPTEIKGNGWILRG